MLEIWHLCVVSFSLSFSLVWIWIWYTNNNTMFKAVKSVEIWSKCCPFLLSHFNVCHTTERCEREREFGQRKEEDGMAAWLTGGNISPLYIKYGNRLKLMWPNKQFQFHIILFLFCRSVSFSLFNSIALQFFRFCLLKF